MFEVGEELSNVNVEPRELYQASPLPVGCASSVLMVVM